MKKEEHRHMYLFFQILMTALVSRVQMVVHVWMASILSHVDVVLDLLGKSVKQVRVFYTKRNQGATITQWVTEQIRETGKSILY